MLTGKKVKRSKQAVQDAFTVLHSNMELIDSNMREMLQFNQDIARVLYVCLDSRMSNILENMTAVN